LLMKALFRMGIPVTGKNLFPSNIQGLPTWYEIRANHAGYMSASGRVDVMVAMNAQTYQKDLDEVSPGGFLITTPPGRAKPRCTVPISPCWVCRCPSCVTKHSAWRESVS